MPKKWQLGVFGAVLILNIFGLYNFYGAKNYLNASYFNDFRGFDFVKDNSTAGDYVILSGDLNPGTYDFYKQKFFSKVQPAPLNELNILPNFKKGSKFWFFATASDDGNTNNTTESKIPIGLRVVKKLESVPLDPNLKKYKEKISGYQSYTYKYVVYLLSN